MKKILLILTIFGLIFGSFVFAQMGGDIMGKMPHQD